MPKTLVILETMSGAVDAKTIESVGLTTADRVQRLCVRTRSGATLSLIAWGDPAGVPVIGRTLFAFLRSRSGYGTSTDSMKLRDDLTLEVRTLDDYPDDNNMIHVVRCKTDDSVKAAYAEYRTRQRDDV